MGANLRLTISVTFSGFRQTGKSFEEITNICLKSGFAGIEGSQAYFGDYNEKELLRISSLFKEAALVIDTYHLPIKDPVKEDIATLYETDRKKVEYRMKKNIDTAVMLGAEIGIIHPTSNKDCYTAEEGFERLMMQMGKTLEAMLKHSEQYDFKIAVENMLPYLGDRLGCKILHMEEIIKRHAHPLLGFCMDTGHALVAEGEKAMDVFHLMKERLFAFHLADNAGDRDSHLAPGRGRFFWKEFVKEFKKLNYTGTVCVEASPFSYGPDYSVDSWKNLHNDTLLLLESADS